ncbi:MAG: O-6-methylguanine DNA methyltransferase [Crocinitomicaceae bacterium]|jgi:O-6-methylguanine DNA methyltransferase
MHLGTSDQGVCMFEFDVPERIERHKLQLSAIFQEVDSPPIDIHKELTTQLDAYFRGEVISFEIPVEFVGTKFQVALWKSLQRIPYGKTITYMNQSIELGNPEAIRAVANANGQNRIAILIPCHRVIGTNGSLQGFSGGLWRKEYLLSLEKGQSRIEF